MFLLPSRRGLVPRHQLPSPRGFAARASPAAPPWLLPLLRSDNFTYAAASPVTRASAGATVVIVP